MMLLTRKLLAETVAAGGGGGWDLSTASYDGVSLSIASEDTVPLSITFKPDGTKMYVMGNANDSIYQYSLS